MSATCTGADRLLDRLEGVKQTGADSWVARCSAHDDRTPSLSVKQAGDRTLVHCFAGCSASDVLAAAGLSLADLYDQPLAHHHKPLERRQRRRHHQASDAMKALENEALIVMVAADRLSGGYGLSGDDLDRLHTAHVRIRSALDLAGDIPTFPPQELRRPLDYVPKILAKFGHEVSA